MAAAAIIDGSDGDDGSESWRTQGIRSCPDAYAPAEKQAKRSRSSVARALNSLPSRELSAVEELQIRLPATVAVGPTALPSKKIAFTSALVSIFSALCLDHRA